MLYRVASKWCAQAFMCFFFGEGDYSNEDMYDTGVSILTLLEPIEQIMTAI